MRLTPTAVVAVPLAAFVTAAVGVVSGSAPGSRTGLTLPALHSQAPGQSVPAQPADIVSSPPAALPGVDPTWLAPGDRRDYVGSSTCRTCHEAEHEQWSRSLHVQMTKPVAETRVLGDFRPGTTLEQHGRRYRFDVDGGKYFVSVSHGGRPFERFEVGYTLGALRFQGYLARLPDGRMYVLPVFWQVASRRWLDWREITPVPDGDHDLRQIWNVTCFNCHATGLARNFDLDSRSYKTTWSEMGIGCEGCHGPGGAHADLMEQWARDPSRTPTLDTRRSNRELGRTVKIFAARTADRREVFDTCAYCHGNKNNLFVGFLPGARFENFALPFLISQPVPVDDPQGDFWPDGRPSRFNRPQALTLSGCFTRSEITCTSCHVAHGSRNAHSLKLPIERSDQLCTQCHAAINPKAADAGEAPTTSTGMAAGTVRPDGAVELTSDEVVRHTHHAAGSAGSRCISCHMSEVNWRLLMRRRDHTFKAPVPELTARLGLPNACTGCHDDQSPEWAMAKMDAWWGDGARRAREVRVATAMYAAAANDPDALGTLAALAVDRSHGPVVRGSAAEFMGRLAVRLDGRQSPGGSRNGQSQTSFETDQPGAGRSGATMTAGRDDARPPDRPPGAAAGTAADTAAVTPAMINALIGAASDPEAMVRAMALRSLGQIGDRRAVTAISARLIDPIRTVRVGAAESLLLLGIATLPGAAGSALVRAQDEYAASLQTFGDMAGDYVALGYVEMERRRDGPARTALERALSLDPANPQPRVFLGVIEARNGRYDAAIREWRRVRDAYPSYPNIDRLIDEAEKRRTPGR